MYRHFVNINIKDLLNVFSKKTSTQPTVKTLPIEIIFKFDEESKRILIKSATIVGGAIVLTHFLKKCIPSRKKKP